MTLSRPGLDGDIEHPEGSPSWRCHGSAPTSCGNGPHVWRSRPDPPSAAGAIKRIVDQLGVRPEALRTWVKQAGVTQDSVERGRELASPVTGEGPELVDSITEVHDEVADLLRGPPTVRIGRRADDMDVAAADASLWAGAGGCGSSARAARAAATSSRVAWM
jgi:hypothetical protein